MTQTLLLYRVRAVPLLRPHDYKRWTQLYEIGRKQEKSMTTTHKVVQKVCTMCEETKPIAQFKRLLTLRQSAFYLGATRDHKIWILHRVQLSAFLPSLHCDSEEDHHQRIDTMAPMTDSVASICQTHSVRVLWKNWQKWSFWCNCMKNKNIFVIDYSQK